MFPQGKTFLTSIIADCEFFEPIAAVQRDARDRLLAERLRPDRSRDYPIASEYPLVLGSEGTRHSICVVPRDDSLEARAIVAHANLWLRTMTSNSQTDGMGQIKLALVGNVATGTQAQGKGWMRKLLAEIERRAQSQGADAIVLWSDLTDFYQKMGFVPAGKELRIMLSVPKLSQLDRPNVWTPEGYQTGKLPHDLMHRMLELRSMGFKQPFFQLERSIHEFSELLKIPDLALFVGHSRIKKAIDTTMGHHDRSIDFYFIIGKGADMQGVIHEWGTTDMNLLLGGAGAIAQSGGLEEIMILVPPAIEEARSTFLHQASTSIEGHAMAWVKPLSPESKHLVDRTLLNGFIWGLDSI